MSSKTPSKQRERSKRESEPAVEGSPDDVQDFAEPSADQIPASSAKKRERSKHVEKQSQQSSSKNNRKKPQEDKGPDED